MEIQEIIIEREESSTYCGILTFLHSHEQQLLTWSFQWGDGQKVILMLYPSTHSGENAGVIQSHYRELADAILGEVFRRV